MTPSSTGPHDPSAERAGATGPSLLAVAYLVFGLAALLAALGVGTGADVALAVDIPLFLAGGLLSTRAFQRAHLLRRGAHGAAGGLAIVAGAVGALFALLALLSGRGDGAALSITLQLFPATSALFGALAALALFATSYPPGARLGARVAAVLLALGALCAAGFTVLTFSLETSPTLVYATAFGAPLALSLGLGGVALAWRRAA